MIFRQRGGPIKVYEITQYRSVNMPLHEYQLIMRYYVTYFASASQGGFMWRHQDTKAAFVTKTLESSNRMCVILLTDNETTELTNVIIRIAILADHLLQARPR